MSCRFGVSPRPVICSPFSLSEFCLLSLLLGLCRSATLIATATPLAFCQGPGPDAVLGVHGVGALRAEIGAPRLACGAGGLGKPRALRIGAGEPAEVAALAGAVADDEERHGSLLRLRRRSHSEREQTTDDRMETRRVPVIAGNPPLRGCRGRTEPDRVKTSGGACHPGPQSTFREASGGVSWWHFRSNRRAAQATRRKPPVRRLRSSVRPPWPGTAAGRRPGTMHRSSRRRWYRLRCRCWR
jgi:hypothetical protein